MEKNLIGTLEEEQEEANAGGILAEIQEEGAQDKFDAEIDNYLQKYVVKLKLNLSIQTETYNQALTVNNLNTEKDKKDCMSSLIKTFGEYFWVLLGYHGQSIFLIPISQDLCCFDKNDFKEVTGVKLREYVKSKDDQYFQKLINLETYKGKMIQDASVKLMIENKQIFCNVEYEIRESQNDEKNHSGKMSPIRLGSDMKTESLNLEDDFVITSENKLSSENSENKIQKTENKKKGFENMSKPKFFLPKWDESASGLDWLEGCKYLISLNTDEFKDSTYVGLLIGGIKSDCTRLKIINELSLLNAGGEITLKQFENVFVNFVKLDKIVYREQLESLKYTSTTNFREFFGSIYNLVVRSTDLDPIQDKSSLEKLSIEEFTKRLPKMIKLQLITTNIQTGLELANMADKIRSYSRIYLTDDRPEINQMNTVEKPSFEKNPEKRVCYFCSKPGHLKSDCRLRNQGSFNNRSRPTNNNRLNSYNQGNQQFESPLVPSGFGMNQRPPFNTTSFNSSGGFQNQDNSNNFRNNLNRQSNQNTVTCYYCNKNGHKANNCFKKQNDQGSSEPFVYTRK